MPLVSESELLNYHNVVREGDSYGLVKLEAVLDLPNPRLKVKYMVS